ncbi:16166_t:CDS:2, partial [Acaulospora colombiana]
DPREGFKLSDAIQPQWIVKWYTRYVNGNTEVKDRIVDFAMVKLLCGNVNKKPFPTRQDLLAIMGLRLGLRLGTSNSSDIDVAQELVERHMRTVVCMDVHSQTFMTNAPSEPVLAEASIRLMQQMTRLRPVKALQQVFEDPLHTKGVRGEFIAALLLLLARDETQREQEGASAKIPVKTLLEKLLGEEVLQFYPNSPTPEKAATTLEDAFKDTYAHFTHAVVVQDEDTLRNEYIWPVIARGSFF